MEKEVSYHSNDILMKSLSELYKDQVLDAYNLDYPKIKEVLPNNFPQMKVDERRADNTFLLEDGSILLLEYETNNNFTENHIKYCDYVLRIVNRYYKENKQLRKVHVAVIYSSDIVPELQLLEMGSMYLETKAVSLRNFDGDEILTNIKTKVESGKKLLKEDIMKLILVPLMKSNQDRHTLIHQSIEVAKEINDDYEQVAVIVGILTATDKVIDEEYSKKVREWLRMTKVEKIYQQEKEEALKQAENEKEKRIKEIAKKMLRKFDADVKEIAEITGLSVDEVKELQEEMK